MDALLAVGGEGPDRSCLASRFGEFGLVCAADSGLDLLHSWGLAPQLIVGDMDSIADASLLSAYPRAEVLRFPEDKDDSDTELGLRILRERGARRVVIAGGGEGRLDHLLAIRALFERECRPDEWHSARESLYYVGAGESFGFACQSGETVSVFPLSGGASGMKSEGLAWPLDGLSWGPGGFGLSNRSIAPKVRIVAGEGALLVIRNRPPRKPS